MEWVKEMALFKSRDLTLSLMVHLFQFNNYNTYWTLNVATDPSGRYKVSQVLQDAADAGLFGMSHKCFC
ncbi:putative mannan endo-1,4-beta-mannosidase [Helianthus anomalus]